MAVTKSIKVSSKFFFIIHEEIVKKADRALKRIGGLDRKSDQTFYGHGEGEGSKRSINEVMKNNLVSKEFGFEGFYFSPEGAPKFNIDYLRKLKAVYNSKAKSDYFDSSTIKMRGQYLNAFLFFLEYKNIAALEKKFSKYKIASLISHTKAAKAKTIDISPSKFFNEDKYIEKGYLEAVKAKVGNTDWYLYTFNFDHNKIVKATLEIKEVGDNKNYVNLVNAGIGYNYIGSANFRLAHHRIIAFDLVSKVVPAKHFHLKFYVNFGRIENAIMLGQQIGFGHSYKIISSKALLIRMDQEEDSPLGIGFYEINHPDLHPAVVKYLRPGNIEYNVIPWHTFFNFDDLGDWLGGPSKDEPPHYTPPEK